MAPRHVDVDCMCTKRAGGTPRRAFENLEPLVEIDSEADPNVARANALANLQAVVDNFPKALTDREAELRREVAAIPGSPAKRLRALYQAMSLFSTAIAPHVACRRGCSACCHINVSIFPLEAQLISAWTGRAVLSRPLSPKDFHGTPCPFLEHGTCSIYEHRPFACRNHFALTKTSYWCQPERSVDGQEFPFVRLSEVDATLVDVIQQDGRLEPLDIRHFFGAQIPSSLKG